MKKIEFTIDHIDPLGQGISKTQDQVCFIEKSLPGESGEIEVIKSKKKGRLIFSRLNSADLHSPSPLRIQPECEHFWHCSGCHYLHVKYEDELELKTSVIQRMFQYLDQYDQDIPLISASKRFHYRNRIQLHYDKKLSKLGFIDSLRNEIREVANCLVANDEISASLKELYTANNWKNLVRYEKNTGHIELYKLGDKVQISINKRYSEGGFTQVNEEMNQKMLSHLEEQVRQYIPAGITLLDLFGGAGNLSYNLEEYETYVVDGFPPTEMNYRPHQSFEQINLYKEGAIDKLQSRCSGKDIAIILDPPRSGLKNINELIQKLKPSFIFMINCEPSSAIRDIKSIEGDFSIENLTTFDLFPGTRHFETFSTLRFG
ncbi:hypothetical protein BIY24_14010 [Halobacteriovorax marinus]|uniref:class I SAM-dependent RNA methyltransferase n=1 Tax=Halobacteriovorax marinus TaxID=97084 RepID=UPI000BC33A07|nr:class I SAM-dependent RNA methyltransferase [Halobacteriovorax marinus]ATH09020.1 hypothetical protein BIY24_14010 [Halobacteriovorax marinus]